MKCPLREFKILSKDNDQITIQGKDCIREGCAWWSEDMKMCSIRELAYEIRAVDEKLKNISSKLHIGI